MKYTEQEITFKIIRRTPKPLRTSQCSEKCPFLHWEYLGGGYMPICTMNWEIMRVVGHKNDENNGFCIRGTETCKNMRYAVTGVDEE